MSWELLKYPVKHMTSFESFVYCFFQVELVILPRSIIQDRPPEDQNKQPPPPPPPQQNQDSSEEQKEEEDKEVPFPFPEF